MAIMADVKIGTRVKEERVKRFWTQEKLAQEANLSPRQVVRIEANEVEPRFSTILRIAQALEVDPNDLVERD